MVGWCAIAPTEPTPSRVRARRFPRTVPQADALDACCSERGCGWSAVLSDARPRELVRAEPAPECPVCKRAYNMVSAPREDGRALLTTIRGRADQRADDAEDDPRSGSRCTASRPRAGRLLPRTGPLASAGIGRWTWCTRMRQALDGRADVGEADGLSEDVTEIEPIRAAAQLVAARSDAGATCGRGHDRRARPPRGAFIRDHGGGRRSRAIAVSGQHLSLGQRRGRSTRFPGRASCARVTSSDRRGGGEGRVLRRRRVHVPGGPVSDEARGCCGHAEALAPGSRRRIREPGRATSRTRSSRTSRSTDSRWCDRWWDTASAARDARGTAGPNYGTPERGPRLMAGQVAGDRNRW
jgi:hypothetical protein